MRAIFILACLLFAMPAYAGSWDKCSSGKGICYTILSADGAGNSVLRYMGESFTMTFSNAGGATRVYLRGPCTEADVDANECRRLLVDWDGDGAADDTPFNGSDQTTIYDIPAGHYYLEISAAGDGVVRWEPKR